MSVFDRTANAFPLQLGRVLSGRAVQRLAYASPLPNASDLPGPIVLSILSDESVATIVENQKVVRMVMLEKLCQSSHKFDMSTIAIWNREAFSTVIESFSKDILKIFEFSVNSRVVVFPSHQQYRHILVPRSIISGVNELRSI